MARVGLVNKEQAAPEIREMFQKMEGNGRPVLNVFKVMAHCPQVGYYFLRLGNSILLKGTVPPTLRELAILRVGHMNQAKYEWTHHVSIALRVGVGKAQIDALHDWEIPRFLMGRSGPSCNIRMRLAGISGEKTILSPPFGVS